MIYALVHPLTLEVRYIGSTARSLKARFDDHLRDLSRRDQSKRNAPLAAWWRESGASIVGLGPGGSEEERAWIARLRGEGARLLNVSAGGPGNSRKARPETRDKIGAANRGRRPSAEARARMSAHHRGAQSPESRAKISATKRMKREAANGLA